MAIALVGSAVTGGQAAVSNQTIPAVTVAAGNLAVMVVEARNSQASLTGWTRQYQTQHTGGFTTLWTATSTTSAATWSASSSSLAYVIQVFSGLDTQTFTTPTSTAQDNSSPIDAPAATAWASGDFLIVVAGVRSSASSPGAITQPTGMTTIAEIKVGTSATSYMAYQQLSASGSTGTRSVAVASLNATDGGTAGSMVLKAASSSTPVTVNADLTNVSVDAQDATVTVTSTVTQSAPSTNLSLSGHAATVTAIKNVSITADAPNIAVAATDTTVTATSPNANVTATTAAITLDAQDAAVAAGGSVIVNAPTGTRTIQGQPPGVYTLNGAELLPVNARTFESGISGWNLSTGASNLTRVSGISNSGSWSMRFTTAVGQPTATIESDAIPVDIDDTYTFQAFVFADGKQLHIDFYNASNAVVQTNSTSIMPDTGGFLYLLWVQAQPPATATYAKLRIFTEETAGSHSYVDDVSFITSSTTGVTFQPPGTNIAVAGLSASVTISAIQTTTAATITVDALDAEVTTMPDAVHVTVGTDTTNLGVDAKTASVSLPNAYYTTVLAAAPVNWYRCNDVSGNLVDSVGGVNITPTGATYSQNGIPTLVGIDNAVSLSNGSLPYNWTNRSYHSYEVWVKTTDTVFWVTSGSSGSAFGGAYVQGGILGWNSSGTFSSWGMNVANNVWHHIVLTEELVGAVKTYKAYFDGAQIGAAGGNFDGWNATETMLTNYTGLVDEIAVYDRTLSAAEVLDHYQKGAYVQADIEVEVTQANVNVNGQATVLNTEVIAPVANINVFGEHPNVITPGQTSLGAPKTNIAVTGHAPTISGEKSMQIYTTAAHITLGLIDHDIRTREDTFKFIPADDLALTALDADELLNVSLGGLLHNQNKYWAFKLGNVGNEKINLTVSIVSDNEDLDDLVQLSTDKSNYSSTIEIESIPPNGISDPIWFRLNSGSARPGAGTFLINVEQSNA